MNILSVRIDNLTKKQALEKVVDFLNNRKQHTIFTPNPEMLVDAARDPSFRDILNRGSLNICDGKGIQFVSTEKIERIPGSDFMLDICRLASEQGRGVYLLGGKNVNQTVEQLKKQFPNLNIVGSHRGPCIIYHVSCITTNARENDEVITDIIAKVPSILFVAFGHPKQETWIHDNLSRLPSVKIAMGVGGAFDFIAGIAKRAPRWMQTLGLEWLWRLIIEPRRIGRIWKATAHFLFLYVTTKNHHTSQ